MTPSHILGRLCAIGLGLKGCSQRTGHHPGSYMYLVIGNYIIVKTEVSKDKEPIGIGRVDFNWFESQAKSDSSELRVKMIWMSNDLRFK